MSKLFKTFILLGILFGGGCLTASSGEQTSLCVGVKVAKTIEKKLIMNI